MQTGYYRFPSIHGDKIVFVCEDDLWLVNLSDTLARRLTSGLAEASHPCFSKDGEFLAFTGREEGQSEVYLMPAEGGPGRRLTYLGGSICIVLDWTEDGKIIFASNARRPFSRPTFLYTVDPDGGQPEQIEVGPASAVCYGPDGAMVIGRDTDDPAYWKRYRGGSAGKLWIDRQGEGEFVPLLQLQSNLASPMWLGERIYFLSDHEGIGNLYSCTAAGTDVERMTDHEAYYARNARSDGKRIVYHAGGDLYLLDPAKPGSEKIEFEFHSPQTQRNRKYVNAAAYVDGWQIHPEGHSLAITSRGKAYSFANWEGAVLQHGEADGPRYRLMAWLNDGERLVAVTDASGEEQFVVLSAEGYDEPKLIGDLDIGRPGALAINPKKDQILFSNHRYELCLLDLENETLTVVDKGKVEPIAGFSWSPDGEWVAYSVSISLQLTVIKLWQAATGTITALTQPVLRDISPTFDPEGRYLYFLSYRHFDPVYDNLQFDLNFPRGMRPYLITLRKDLPSPFIPVPRAPGKNSKKRDENDKTTGKAAGTMVQPELTHVEASEKPDQESAGTSKDVSEGNGDGNQENGILIDLDGIERRIVAFPVPEGKYSQIYGLDENIVLYSRTPVKGSLSRDIFSGVPIVDGTIYSYDFQKQEEESLISRVTSFKLSRDRHTLGYQSGYRLRLLKAGEKPAKDAGSSPGRESGWIDLRRVKVSIIPGSEWSQMYREAWRLQRDQFWTADMSAIDWQVVYDRYLPLVDRVASKSEFSDLLWEMQGELGTSHSYVIGGDYRPEPGYYQGYLGASFALDEENDSWQITDIVQGDPWDEGSDSPLNNAGINVLVGDRLVSVNGRRLSRTLSPDVALVNLANEDVTLGIIGEGQESPRLVTVKTLARETPARYRSWVEANRRLVHEATSGKAGYIHIPDMGPTGYAEFHRGFLAEIDRQGLIVDVRNNSGGHVSQLLLEKLLRKRIGYDVGRWMEVNEPYPMQSVAGPIVGLTNQYAGSDGDIFSHGFKLFGIGPLIGTRTWGGVIGINPRHRLVDGTVTTQPEFSFWFRDVGFGVENYGTDPDIEVFNRPQDWIAGVDAQLNRAIEELLALLEDSESQTPDLMDRPNLSLPKLPPRA